MSDTRTFKNTSSDVFIDGDLVVKPGDAFSTDKDGRIIQMTDMYKWQFEEVDEDAPTEDEMKARPNDVREVRASDHVELDEDGNRAEKLDNTK
jgi:hypothetical protein